MSRGAIAGLVLAAGESRRIGKDKALLHYHGRPFLEVILENLNQAGIDHRVVVLGHHAEMIQDALSLGDDAGIVINPDYRQGQTSSLQAGLRAINEAGVDAILLCLVDHPVANAETMRQLVQAFLRTRAPVVIPVYQGLRGHPVLINRTLFPELLGLDLRQGANSIVRKYHNETEWVTVDDPGVVVDIDELEDYQDLTRAEE